MSRLLTDLRPEIRPMVDKFLAAVAAADIDLLVTCTLRTFAEQTALYAQGRTTPGVIVTRAQAGQSAHNYGLALDVVPVMHGKPDWVGSDPVWEQVGEMGEQAGLEWFGAAGQPFVELAHFQHPEWKLISQQLQA